MCIDNKFKISRLATDHMLYFGKVSLPLILKGPHIFDMSNMCGPFTYSLVDQQNKKLPSQLHLHNPVVEKSDLHLEGLHDI